MRQRTRLEQAESEGSTPLERQESAAGLVWMATLGHESPQGPGARQSKAMARAVSIIARVAVVALVVVFGVTTLSLSPLAAGPKQKYGKKIDCVNMRAGNAAGVMPLCESFDYDDDFLFEYSLEAERNIYSNVDCLAECISLGAVGEGCV